MVVLGGPGTLVGGLIGATVVVFLREYLATGAVVAVRARRGLRAHDSVPARRNHGFLQRRKGMKRIAVVIAGLAGGQPRHFAGAEDRLSRR